MELGGRMNVALPLALAPTITPDQETKPRRISTGALNVLQFNNFL